MIQKIGNVILLGTSHVAKQSAIEIENAINNYSPEVVAIELDINRLNAVLGNKSSKNNKKSYKSNLLKEVGLSGYLFAKLAGYIQEKVGKSLGIDPGVDMKTAYLKARENKITTALIDLNIKLTLKKMSHLSFMRKMKMFFNLVFKSFKKEYRHKLNFDPGKGVPDEKVIQMALEVFEKEVPDLYKILIEDRNKYMVNRILKLQEAHVGNILVVIGAGHLKGMVKELEEKSNIFNIDVNNSINFSFSINS